MKINDDQILGLDSEEEPSFRWSGCDNCNNKLGNTVYESKAHFKSGETWDHYEINLCGTCLCAFHNGEELDSECKNKFQI